MRKLLLLLTILPISTVVLAQNNCEKAQKNFDEAVKSIDAKQFVLAEQLLKEAITLCPSEDYKYSFELAWNYYLIKEYSQAIKCLTPYIERDSIPADFYQLLGNIYDESSDEGMAVISYNKGLVKYPNAGCLFLERGNICNKNSDFRRALFYYEDGILKDPKYASNYFRAAKIFLGSSEEVWGLMYGEIFMNLEKNSDRAKEMSKMLYDTYHSEITFNTDGIVLSFNDPTIIYSDSPEHPNLFPENFYNSMLKACKGERIINISTLVDIRTRFIRNFYTQSHSFKNLLFDYHKTLIDLGYFEAYNYWLFGYGNSVEASKWISQNKGQFDKFMNWYNNNPIPINKDNVFTRYKME